MQSPKYSTRREASAYLQSKWGLKRSPNYLAKLAVVGGGPAFHKAGRDPLYSPADLDLWAEKIIGPPGSSTTEHRVTATAEAV